MKISFSLFFIFFTFLRALPQERPPAAGLKTACDCKDAIPLNIDESTKYGPTQAPVSFGEIQEITATDKNSEISFSKEHNSAWYLLNIKFDGELTFEIVALDSSNDYDFLLYPYTGSGFCSSVQRRGIKPVRGNISNNKWPDSRGLTGLSANATQLFHKQGLGNPFSKSITVKRGEQYMLVLDNYTPNGRGHTIYFHGIVTSKNGMDTLRKPIEPTIRKVIGGYPIELKGTVVGSDSEPIVAEVKLIDYRGKTVAETTTGAKGTYQIKTAIEEGKNYSLNFSGDSSFPVTKIINTASLYGENAQLNGNAKIVLPKLIKGAKYPLGNINFYPNVATLVPGSFSSVQALLQLMERYNNMVILIEGHVNGVDLGGIPSRELYRGEFQTLSDDRAATVRKYLVNNGISSNRIKTIGLSTTQMLFPKAKSLEEQRANMRVEIKIISIDGK